MLTKPQISSMPKIAFEERRGIKKMKFHQKLMELRLASRLSQESAASLIGKSYGAYRAYEQARTTPSPEVLMKICRIFGTTPNDILEF